MRIAITFCFMLLSLFSFAQSTTVSGKVLDSKTGKGIAGASVQVVSTKKGVSTASDGSFTVTAAANDELQISAVGYKTTTFAVAGRTTLEISLDATAQELGEVVLVGTRRAGRVKIETPVPVDLVNIGQISATTARTDITSILNYAAPSFNYNKQSGSDGADHIDLATLRGLGPRSNPCSGKR